MYSPRMYDEKYIKAIQTQPYNDEIKAISGVKETDIVYTNSVLSAFGCITAGEMLLEGKINNAFVLNRPPGHHAYAYLGGGFCYLNNTAILSRY